jgi:hypothetical protein
VYLHFILLGWTFAALVLIAGSCIAHRKHYTFCFVMACVECLSMPFGTVLGVFTILVLNRQKDLLPLNCLQTLMGTSIVNEPHFGLPRRGVRLTGGLRVCHPRRRYRNEKPALHSP